MQSYLRRQTEEGRLRRKAESNMTVSDKKMYLETKAGSAVVVTAETSRGFETRVIGSSMDGWVLPMARTEQGASYNHKWVVRLVKESELTELELVGAN